MLPYDTVFFCFARGCLLVQPSICTYVYNVYVSFGIKTNAWTPTLPTEMPSTDLPLFAVGSCTISSVFVVLVLLFICSSGTAKTCTSSTSSTPCVWHAVTLYLYDICVYSVLYGVSVHRQVCCSYKTGRSPPHKYIYIFINQ